MSSSRVLPDSNIKHEKSEESVRSELVAKIPNTDISVLKTEVARFTPKVDLRINDDPIVIEINADANNYLDFYNSSLYVRAKIVNQNGTPLAAEVHVAPSNAFFHAWMSDIEVELNHVNITKFGGHNPYVGYISTLLASSPDQKSGELQNILYYPGKVVDKFDDKTDVKDGFSKRVALAAESKSFEMLGKLPLNICLQPRYLPPKSDLKITIRRSLPQFCIEASQDTVRNVVGLPYKYIIEDLALYVPKHKVNEKVISNQRQELSDNGRLTYPIYANTVKTYVLSTGIQSHTMPSFIKGPLPQKIYIGLVSNAAFNGKLTKSPFNFQHFKVSSISLNASFSESLYKTIEYDFDNNHFLGGLASLKDAAVDTLLGNGITRENFKNGKIQHSYKIIRSSLTKICNNNNNGNNRHNL